jgi:hypothetical protein
MNESFNVAPGGAVESYQPRNKINQIYSVWVDNFSGGWLGIEGRNLWIPPYTRGWKASIFPGMSSITIRSYNFANGATIAAATGQAAIVTLWDAPQGDSEGIEFFDQQTIPTVLAIFDNVPAAATLLIAAPIAGRIRVYEIQLTYDQDNAHTSESVLATFLTTFADVTILSISPASPTNSKIFTTPGGDLPINTALNYILNCPDGGAVTQSVVRILIRYAVI